MVFSVLSNALSVFLCSLCCMHTLLSNPVSLVCIFWKWLYLWRSSDLFYCILSQTVMFSRHFIQLSEIFFSFSSFVIISVHGIRFLSVLLFRWRNLNISKNSCFIVLLWQRGTAVASHGSLSHHLHDHGSGLLISVLSWLYIIFTFLGTGLSETLFVVTVNGMDWSMCLNSDVWGLEL